MHMCIELGILRKQIKDAKGKEKLVTEYLDAELNDNALEAVLKIGYEQFKVNVKIICSRWTKVYAYSCLTVLLRLLCTETAQKSQPVNELEH